MTTGRRKEDQPAAEPDHGHWYFAFEPGDFGKDTAGRWWVCPPDERFREIGACSIEKHDVTEHEDRTITVAPSILIRASGFEYHGWLAGGVWRNS